MDHGTLSPFDLRNTLVVEGPDFRVGGAIRRRAGNVDIAPTLAQVLRLAPGTAFDGRVLNEALRDAPDGAPDWTTRQHALSFSARGQDWVQRAWFACVGSHAYLAGGAVEPAWSLIRGYGSLARPPFASGRPAVRRHPRTAPDS